MAASLICSTVRAQAPVFTTGTPAELQRAQSIGLEHLMSTVRQPGVELKAARVSVDQLSMAHVRVQQFYRGIPVSGGEAIAHLRPDGTLSGITDNLVHAIQVTVTPVLAAPQAIERARADAGLSPAVPGEPTASLWILRRDGADHLVHRVEFPIVAPKPRRPVVFVDAHTGDVVLRYDNLQTEAPQ
jgi:Zn-dependent metalloprotease